MGAAAAVAAAITDITKEGAGMAAVIILIGAGAILIGVGAAVTGAAGAAATGGAGVAVIGVAVTGASRI